MEHRHGHHLPAPGALPAGDVKRLEAHPDTTPLAISGTRRYSVVEFFNNIAPAAGWARQGAWGLRERRAWLLPWPDAALTHGRK
ncbi:MAG: hypothetical protein Kow0054_22740 [Deferrisoma sp.]